MAVDDVKVGVVIVKEGQVEVEMVGQTLWSAGWNHKLVSHQV